MCVLMMPLFAGVSFLAIFCCCFSWPSAHLPANAGPGEPTGSHRETPNQIFGTHQMHFWERLSKRNHVSKGSRNLSPKEHLPVVSTLPGSLSFREVQKLFPGFQVQSNLTQKWLRGNPLGLRFIPARSPSGFQLDFKLDSKWRSTGSACARGL